MIKVLLFALGFVLLAACVGLGIYFGYKYYDAKENGNDIDAETIKKKYITQLKDFAKKNPDKAAQQKESDRLTALFEEEIETLRKGKPKGFKRFIGTIIGALVCLGFVITIPGSFHQVEAGSVAVVKRLGKIVDVREPGTYFDFYMINEYETYDSTVQQVEINTESYSKDGQTMGLEVYLQYEIQVDKLLVRDDDGNIIQTEGIAGRYITLSSLQSRIQTQCIEKTKAVMSSAEAMVIIQNRATYSQMVSQTVRDAIGEDYYVNVQDVVLTDIKFTDEFEKSVEDKVVAEQEKQAAITRAESELEVAKLEAQTKIEGAKGDAEAQKIVAQAAAEAATYKIIELAKSVGYTVNETYVYSHTLRDAENAVTGVVEETYATKQAETTDMVFVGTKYDIDTSTGPGVDKFNEMVLSYIEYLAYLEKWNGELPQVMTDGGTISSILLP